MASHLVSQHQLASYATPINGGAGDATVVLGNDNTTVTGYNSHDSDATIHVQSSSAATFAATPAATEGRKWMTQDSGAVYLYYDTGSAWVEVNYLRNTGGTITSSSATALTVGRQGATDPVFQVDASTASVATGIKIKGAAAAAGVAISVISSGTNENLTIDAKGSGTVTINATGTGGIALARATTVTGSLTATADLFAGAATEIGWTGRATMKSSADGIIEIYNDALTGFTRLCLGGTTSAFPAVVRNGTKLEVKLADNSGHAAIVVKSVQLEDVAPTVGGGEIGIGAGTSGTASAGGATLPGNPVGFWIINVAGTDRKVPYYAT